MPDVDDLRELMTRLVYENLADRSFRKCLTAEAPDGSRPIIVVLPTDPVRELLRKVDSLGGNGNVVMPKANGFMVVAMIHGDDDGEDAPLPHDLTPDCTVGVFFARVFADDGGEYRFMMDSNGQRHEHGRAELVAVGR